MCLWRNRMGSDAKMVFRFNIRSENRTDALEKVKKIQSDFAMNSIASDEKLTIDEYGWFEYKFNIVDQILNKILSFDVIYKPYNNILYGANKNSWIRPLFKWETQLI